MLGCANSVAKHQVLAILPYLLIASSGGCLARARMGPPRMMHQRVFGVVACIVAPACWYVPILTGGASHVCARKTWENVGSGFFLGFYCSVSVCAPQVRKRRNWLMAEVQVAKPTAPHRTIGILIALGADDPVTAGSFGCPCDVMW